MPDYTYEENILRLKRLRAYLPQDYLKLPTKTATLDKELVGCIERFSECKSSDNDEDQTDDLIKTLIDIVKNCDLDSYPDVETTQTYQLLRFLLAGFIWSLKPNAEQEEELANLGLINNNFSEELIHSLAFSQGDHVPLEDICPEEIQDKKLFDELLKSVKFIQDPMGPNLFGLRKLPSYSQQKPIRGIDNMLQQSDLLALPRAKKTLDTRADTIHLIWFGGIPPKEYWDNIKSWKMHNPLFDVILYLDHKTAIEIQNKAHPEFSEWAKKHGIHLVDISRVIGYHFLYPYICHELTKPNYGAASDMARYILVALYKGGYFDIPDATCLQKLPKFRKNTYCRRCKDDDEEDMINNDYFIIVSKKGQKLLKKAMARISRNYQCGYSLIQSRNPRFTENNLMLYSLKRRINQTLNRTGAQNFLRVIGESFLKYNELDGIIKFDFASSWVSINNNDKSLDFNLAQIRYKNSSRVKKEEKEEKVKEKEEKISEKPTLNLLQEALTDLIEEIRMDPRLIDFDKYTIFKNSDYIKMALFFLKNYFPELLNQVENIIAYSTEDVEGLVKFLNEKVSWCNLGWPLIHWVCYTQNIHASEEQTRFLQKLLTCSPDQLEVKNDEGCTPLIMAASSHNISVMLFLINAGANLLARNNNDLSFVDIHFEGELPGFDEVEEDDDDLVHAWNESRKNLLEMLINKCPELFISNQSGCNPLIRLTNTGSYSFAEYVCNLLYKNFDKISALKKHPKFSQFQDDIQTLARELKNIVVYYPKVRSLLKSVQRLHAHLSAMTDLRFPRISLFAKTAPVPSKEHKQVPQQSRPRGL